MILFISVFFLCRQYTLAPQTQTSMRHGAHRHSKSTTRVYPIKIRKAFLRLFSVQRFDEAFVGGSELKIILIFFNYLFTNEKKKKISEMKRKKKIFFKTWFIRHLRNSLQELLKTNNFLPVVSRSYLSIKDQQGKFSDNSYHLAVYSDRSPKLVGKFVSIWNPTIERVSSFVCRSGIILDSGCVSDFRTSLVFYFPKFVCRHSCTTELRVSGRVYCRLRSRVSKQMNFSLF